MSKMTSLADVVTEGERLAGAVGVNADNLPTLDVPRAELEALLEEAHSLSRQQKALAASKQEVTKRLEDVLNAARKLITVLRVTVKQRYGFTSEKLVEFGIQPLRPRSRPSLAPTVPVPPPAIDIPPLPAVE